MMGKWIAAALVVLAMSGVARGQSFGVETHNTLMPASGGMGGVSVAQPQDLTSAINGNPATLTQFVGTNFLFSGTWIEPTFNFQQSGAIPPIIAPFYAKSEAQGNSAANIGATQDLDMLGLPATLGIGFLTAAGGGIDLRQVPASNGTNSVLDVFEVTAGLGIDLTDAIAVGASMSVGTALFDGPFVGIGGMSYDYALRGGVGLVVRATPTTRFGAYYQSTQQFQFKNAIQLALGGGAYDVARDVELGLPDNVGYGISNTSLLGGRLLLAADLIYKQWDNAHLFQAIYDNQWVLQLGAQLTRGRGKFRLGYVYAENPLAALPALTVGGVPLPRLTAEAYYLQGQLAVTNPHRFTGGIGIDDVLPSVDFDLCAGGMFFDATQLGALTRTTLESYWIGAGITWKCGCRCADRAAPRRPLD